MITFLTAIHITTVVLLVITVLLQSGKGAEISASFGGSSQTVFGSSGGANFFQKLTYTLAAVFMVTSLTLTILPGKTKRSVFEGYSTPATSTAPVNPAAPAAGTTGAAATTGATAPATATTTTKTETKTETTATATKTETAPAKPADPKKK
jgi:preprotein translocase subunit SecG